MPELKIKNRSLIPALVFKRDLVSLMSKRPTINILGYLSSINKSEVKDVIVISGLIVTSPSKTFLAKPQRKVALLKIRSLV